MKKSGMNPGLLNDANQIKDRANGYSSTSEHLNLSGNLFMAQVRSDRPKNEDLIRGIPVVDEIMPETLAAIEKTLIKEHGEKKGRELVRECLQTGIFVMVSA